MLTDIDRLIAEYVAAHQRTGALPDPQPYLERAPTSDRAALARRIEEMLLEAPRREWDQGAFEATLGSPLMREIETAVRGASGLWPALLPRLRNAARLKRREVVQQLAQELGVTGREEKVGRYYHEMEQGLLDEQGVSDRVMNALAGILGAPAETLREAGRALGSPPFGTQRLGAPVYTRTALPDTSHRAADQDEFAQSSEESWDEVDELFAGAAG